MFSQSRADYHIFSIDRDQSPVIFREQLGLRCNQSANSRNSYNASMQMSGKCQICPPGCISIKINRVVCQENMKNFRIRYSEFFPQILSFKRQLPKLFIKRKWKLIAVNPDFLPFPGKIHNFICQDSHAARCQSAAVNFILRSVCFRALPHT